MNRLEYEVTKKINAMEISEAVNVMVKAGSRTDVTFTKCTYYEGGPECIQMSDANGFIASATVAGFLATPEYYRKIYPSEDNRAKIKSAINS